MCFLQSIGPIAPKREVLAEANYAPAFVWSLGYVLLLVIFIRGVRAGPLNPMFRFPDVASLNKDG